MKLSIVTPSLNQSAHIEATIRSVLSQDVMAEHLVFDGGSGDGTLQILEKYNDKLIWQSEPDNGQADAVNKAIAKATGEIIGWLNSDDIYYPNCFAKVMRVFRENPKVDVVYGKAHHIDASGGILDDYPTRKWDFDQLVKFNYICQPAVFFRKKIFSDYGPLDTRFHYSLDYEYWLRIGRTTSFHYLEHFLAGSRMYPENKTCRNQLAVHEEVLLALEKHRLKVAGRWIFAFSHALVESEALEREKGWCGLLTYRLLIESVRKFFHYQTLPTLRELGVMTWWLFNSLASVVQSGVMKLFTR